MDALKHDLDDNPMSQFYLTVFQRQWQLRNTVSRTMVNWSIQGPLTMMEGIHSFFKPFLGSYKERREPLDYGYQDGDRCHGTNRVDTKGQTACDRI